MATLKFTLDRRRPNADGRFPLRLAVTSNRVTRYVGLGISLFESEWSASAQLVSATSPYFRETNKRLADIYDLSQKVLCRMGRDASATACADAVRLKLHAIDGSSPDSSFISCLERFANLGKKPRTRELYMLTARRMRDFEPSFDSFAFEDITRDWVLGFSDWLVSSQHCSQNYVNILLRNIRAVFNYALDEELTECYPFRRLKIKAVATPKRSLTVEELRYIFNYRGEDYMAKYVDMFKLMFLLCGINGADLFNLKGIVNGRIEYNRAKTGKLYTIKVEPEAAEIIERYKGAERLVEVGESARDYLNFMRRMNKELKKIDETRFVGAKRKKEISPMFPSLSTYWARHTWATIAADIDVPDAVISQALGHSPENTTTEIYIRRNQRKVDEANRRVIDWVLYGRR